MLDDAALDLLFRTARTQNGWLDQPVTEEELHRLYDLVKFGPTTVNAQPGRYVFVRSAAGKERLRPTLAPGNLDKTMAAPVTVIVGFDTRFHDLLHKTFPHAPGVKDYFADDAARVEHAFRNGSLQAGYLILAARAIGLDAGPMSGFDRAKVDAEFFPDGRTKSNLLINLGHGDPAKVFPRSPRLDFAEAAEIL